jgi:hypothetical protein
VAVMLSLDISVKLCTNNEASILEVVFRSSMAGLGQEARPPWAGQWEGGILWNQIDPEANLT